MAKAPYKPTALRAIEGGRSHSLPKPEEVNEPKPTGKAPPPPTWLDTQGKKAYKTATGKLERVGLMTEVDGDAFAFLCQIRSRLIDIIKYLNKQNRALVQEKVFVDPTGQEHHEIKQSPYAVMEKQYLQLYRQYAAEFGLTPRGRTGLSVGKGKDDGEDLLS